MHSRKRTNTRMCMRKRHLLMTTTMLTRVMTILQSRTITTTIAPGIARLCCPAFPPMRTRI